MIVLPTERKQVENYNPNLMVLFGKPKSGKSTLMASLDSNLIIDLEDGAGFVEALKLKVDNIGDLLKLADAIKAAGNPYKYISLDTATALEDDFIQKLAIRMYQATPYYSHRAA